VADQQAVGVVRYKVVPLMRLMVENPVVDILISVFSAIKSAVVLGLI